VTGGDLAVSVAVSVTNTGPVAGAEVVQVYVRDLESGVTRPVRELKGFTKLWLEPGETQRATVSLDERSFAFWSIVHHRWVVEAGEFELGVGTSSRDLPLAETITLDAPSIAAPIGPDSTLHEWLADEQGRRLLLELDAPLLADDHLISVIGTMPMATLAAFGMGVDYPTLDRMTSRLSGG
jgi:beta-glucosidase